MSYDKLFIYHILLTKLPNFGKTSIAKGLRKATKDKSPVKVVAIYRWHNIGKAFFCSVSGHRAPISSIDPDCTDVLPVIAVVFSPQFSSYNKNNNFNIFIYVY